MRKQIVLVSLMSAVLVGVGTVTVTVGEENPDIDIREGTQKWTDGCCVGSRSLSISVLTDDGEAIDNEHVTILEKKTGKHVFDGTTDNAGQIDVTLPQGDYDVVVQDQQQHVHLHKNDTVTFTLDSSELPKT